jgi:putative endonuclease
MSGAATVPFDPSLGSCSVDMLSILTKWISAWLESRATIPSQESLGARGEREAERLLKSKGYRILERSLQMQQGEIDLVAVDGRTIVFVEVKTRTTDDPREPFEAVDRAKQRQVAKLALVYLKRHQLLEHAARFDVVGVNWPAGQSPIVRHYENAFESTERGQMFS